MNIAVVDDVSDETETFIAAIKEYSELNKLKAEVKCFKSAEEFLEDYAPLKYTFIILDIYMGGMTGLEAAKKIRETDRNAMIVFLSSSSDHFPDALMLHAFDYVRKPADRARIFGLLDDITLRKTALCKSLNFVCERANIRIPYGGIAVICANGHYCEITDTDGNLYKPRMSYSLACDTLSEDERFLTINRGVLVNMDCIISFENGVCNLENGEKFPINVKNRKKLEQTWQNYVFADVRKNA